MRKVVTSALFITLILMMSQAWAVTVSVRVTGSNNDGEEQNPPNNQVYRNSTDLELAYDGNTRQHVGMRFQGLNIPQGETINSAYIEFEVDETDSGITNVVIYGQDSDDAGTLGNGANNITNRTRTSASVNWSIPAWNSVNATQQTPDIASIIQEIIDRGGWSSGNDLVIIIEPGAGCNSSSCQRTAESVDGEAASAPLLVVNYGASSGGGSCETFRDEFNTSAFNNNDGTVNWTGNWVEVDGNGAGAGSGNAQISGGNLNLDDQPNTNGEPSLAREADLSNYDTATLSFNFATTSGVDSGDAVVLEISNNGGASYSTVETFTGLVGATSGSRSIDITSSMSANSRIRFRVSNLYGGGSETFEVDNLEIEACSAAPATILSWFQLDDLPGSWNGSAGEITDQVGNINGAFALGTGFGVSAAPAQVCNGINVPSNTSDSEQYGFDSTIDVDADIGNRGTISFWYRSNTDWVGGGDRSLFDASADDLTSQDHYFLLTLRNNGTLVFGLEDSADGDFRIYSGVNNIAANTWVHMAVTWDINNERRLYLNGSLIGSESGNTNGTMGEFRTLYFGDNRSTYHPDGTPNSANGVIDEIRIYPFVQTATEVETDRQSDINSTRACPFTPLAEWRFDECSYSGVAGEVLDAQGNFNATPFNGVSTNTTGQVGNYLDETTNTHQLRTVNAVPMTTTWTVGTWFQMPITTTHRYHVLGAMDGGGDLMYLDRNQNFRWGVYTPSGGVSNGSFNFGTLSAGWHHLMLVGNDSGANGQTLLYIDGAYVETVNLQSQGDFRYIGTSFDGANSGSAQGFGTSLDEFLIFDEVFDATQVAAIYNNQLSGNNYDGSARISSPCNSVDHYAIAHGGTGITCEAEVVTITAHDISHNAVAPSSSTTITLSTSIANDGWALRSGNGSFSAPNQYTFDGVESSVEFWLTKTSVTSAPHMDIDVTDGTATDLDGDASEDQNLEFRDAAFRFYADAAYNAIGSQVAGKWSNDNADGFVTQALSLRAVQTNTDTMACEARVTGTLSVPMAFECINPTTCKTSNGVTLIDSAIGGAGDTLSDNPLGGPISYSNVDLTFDANGRASWRMKYDDAGQIRLHANLTLPASPPDPAVTLSGTSNTFASVPAGLCVSTPDANSSCDPANASCSAFRRAGEAFNLDVRAVAFQIAGESNTDFCSANATTPNFQYSNLPLGHNLLAPAGVAGTIGVNAFNLVAADDGDHRVTNQTISEVGVFNFFTPALSYFSETIAASTSANIGRFYPHHFVLSDAQLTNRSDLGCASAFTYMEENFQTSFDLEARNMAGVVTQNYTTASGFAKLDSEAELNYAAVDLGRSEDLSARLNVGSPDVINFIAGVADADSGLADTLTDTLSLSRLTIAPYLDGPFALSIGVAPQDDDGVQLNSFDLDVSGGGNDHAELGSTVINYGRLSINNAYGSELRPLTISMRTQSYDDSSGTFIANNLDNCTPYNVTNIDLNAASTTYIVPLASTDIGLTGAGLFSLGAASFSLHDDSVVANGPSVTGEVIYNMAVPNYLQFDWNGDNAYTDDPRAKASFGIYQGNPTQIYYRQIYQ